MLHQPRRLTAISVAFAASVLRHPGAPNPIPFRS